MSEIRVSLNYQPLPPFYLADRFAVLKGDVDRPAARRLLAVVSYLTLDNPLLPIEKWQLQIACTRIPADGAATDCVKPSPTEAFLRDL